MGIFSAIKNSFSSSGLAEYWTVPEETSQVSNIAEASNDRPQLIYKHSYRCSTCMFTKSRIEGAAKQLTEQADLHFVDVIANRPISNFVAKELNVQHESPQLLIIKNKEVVWHASHHSIKADAILEILER